MMNGWGWNPGSTHWGYYGFGGGLVMILIGVAVIIGIVLFIRWVAKHPGGGGFDDSSNSRRTAREILDERYAKGDISREEYVQMKSDLENKE